MIKCDFCFREADEQQVIAMNPPFNLPREINVCCRCLLTSLLTFPNRCAVIPSCCPTCNRGTTNAQNVGK